MSEGTAVGGDVQDKVELGRYLAMARAERGRDVRELARATRIPATLLEALELGDAERLPDRVFLANYLRAYAAELGLPQAELEARFLAAYGREEALDPPALERERRRKATRQLLAAALALGVAAGALVMWKRSREARPEGPVLLRDARTY